MQRKATTPVRIPIIGTVSAAGIKLTAEEQRAESEAKAVAAFLNNSPPDFLLEGVLVALQRAFDYFGLAQPKCDPAIGKGLGDYTETNLLSLFRKTKLTSLDDIYARKRQRK